MSIVFPIIKVVKNRLVQNFLSACLTMVVFYFLYVTLWDNIELFQSDAFVPPAIAIIAALVLYGAWLWVYALAWKRLLLSCCGVSQRPRALQLHTIFFKSMLARYVPGKIWPLVVRTRGLTRLGFRAGEAVRSMLYEQMHLQIATAAISAALLPLLPWLAGSVSQALPYAIVVVVFLTVFGAVWVLRPQLVFGALRRAGSRIGLAGKLRDLETHTSDRRAWRSGFFAFLPVATLQGLAIVPLLLSGYPESIADASILSWLVVVGAYSVARFVGQFGSLVPGGLGVREGVYVLLVSDVLPETTSFVIVVWLRVVAICCEVAFYGGLYGMVQIQKYSE